MSSNKQPPVSDPLRESAHQIWLAGLGAFNKAQEEGSKMFDALVQEGVAMQRKAQATAEQKLGEAGQKMNAMAEEISQRASGQWNRFESLFEERVARALERLGIPSAREVKALRERLAELEKRPKARASAKKKSAPARKAGAKKTPAKKAPARKAAPRKAARKKAT